jgi:hypothetical protein
MATHRLLVVEMFGRKLRPRQQSPLLLHMARQLSEDWRQRRGVRTTKNGMPIDRVISLQSAGAALHGQLSIALTFQS